MTTPVRIADAGTPNLRNAAVETLVAAFAAEPGWSHALPSASRRILVLRAALGVLCGDAARRGTLTVALIDDDVVGASVGLAPGYHPSAWRSPAYVVAAAAIVRHAGTASLLLWRRWRTVRAADPRELPHWHLAELGVRPDAQRRGVGRSLLDAFLVRVDERGAAAYLETPRPELVTWYGASGFEVRERVVVTGGASAWTMWRAGPPSA